ncbi:hypothetical protein LCGC14_0415970 [marine sediment metagenome]|uniref:Uncharacterized protein n=1 Tax=marine sediment metagenome TaxID=412755 RepID=A0A0F9VEG1_9ZZZZ
MNTTKAPPPNSVSKKGPPAKPTVKSLPPKNKEKLRPKKTFSVSSWNSDGEGKRVGIVADSGLGKTTLASTAPTPVFVGLDEGGREIKNPFTGEDLKYIAGVEDYYDVKQVMKDHSLFKDYETVVVDTVTMVESVSIPWIVENIKTEKGATVENIIAYGYNKGFRHVYDTFASFLRSDCDSLIHAGKNVILIGQSTQARVANAAGEDFIRDDVRLQHQKEWSNLAQFNEWADHILRIRYVDMIVDDKKVSGTTERGIFFKPELHYFAKSRTIKLDGDYIPYESPEDNTLWDILFPDTAEIPF